VRVTFFEPNEQVLTNDRKGRLFEMLSQRLVEACGYEDVRLRRKHNSLEYDIEGHAALTRAPLSGEAKALDRNIDGQTLAAFVGKLVPLANQQRIDGLFISVSPFTPDAEDYLDKVKPAVNFPSLTLTTIVGHEIPTFLSSRMRYAPENVMRDRVQSSFQLEAFDVWLVVTERDEFFVVTCGPNIIQTPTNFAVFNADGSDLQLDENTLGRLQSQLADLSGLTLAEATGQQSLPARAERLSSIDAGTGWFDYRFPAPPDCFIGRDSAISEVASTVEEIRAGSTTLRGVQILSRSGVGKSSLLLKIAADLPQASVVTIDARSLRVPSDMRLVAATLVEQANRDLGLTIAQPRTHDDASTALEQVGEALGSSQRVAVVQLDQFESTLARPTVFAAVLDLVGVATSRGLPIVWVFARKNDLSVTFDDGARIDLERLNNQSKPIALEDFLPLESRELLERLAKELGGPLRQGLAEAISTFSAGFPWLHKRLCAHVLSMQNEGVSQDELLQQGLRAEDLFDEDMAGLKEADKALLRRIAAELPSTGEELARSLEAEVTADRLTQVLNEFLSQKLLRLSGDVYDTYNDVFKTYLITNQIPFKSRYIFRISPGAALSLLPKIAEISPTTPAGLLAHIGGKSRIALFNKLRELKLLGLIDSQKGRIALKPETQAAMENQQLGELLRMRLRGNALVVRVLDLVSASESVTMQDIARELSAQLPHVHVEEETWKRYARLLARWLDFAGLAYITGEALGLREFAAEDILRGRDFYSARFVPNTFMPSVRPRIVVALMEALREAGELKREAVYEKWGKRNAPGALRDAESLDLVVFEGEFVRPGTQGQILFRRTPTITELDVSQLALTKPNVRAVLAAAEDSRLDESKQREVLVAFGSANWEESTWNWRLGILRAWLVASGQVKSKRGGIQSAHTHT
jgi:hypothetical protein